MALIAILNIRIITSDANSLLQLVFPALIFYGLRFFVILSQFRIFPNKILDCLMEKNEFRNYSFKGSLFQVAKFNR